MMTTQTIQTIQTTANNARVSSSSSSFQHQHQRGRGRFCCAVMGPSSSSSSRTTTTTTRTKKTSSSSSSIITTIAFAKKGGAFLKEFAPEPSPEEKQKREERERKEQMERTGGFPELTTETTTTTDDDDKVFNCNIMVKTKGFGVTWNGIGTLTVPDGGTKEMSTNIARVCCAQRKQLLRSNCKRLYPKMQKLPIEWAVQPFDDPYADPLDLDMVLEGEHASEMIPGNLNFLKKGRAVGPGGP